VLEAAQGRVDRSWAAAEVPDRVEVKSLRMSYPERQVRPRRPRMTHSRVEILAVCIGTLRSINSTKRNNRCSFPSSDSLLAALHASSSGPRWLSASLWLTRGAHPVVDRRWIHRAPRTHSRTKPRVGAAGAGCDALSSPARGLSGSPSIGWTPRRATSCSGIEAERLLPLAAGRKQDFEGS